MSLRAMRPSAVKENVDAVRSGLATIVGVQVRAVHSLTAKSSPQRGARRSKHEVGHRREDRGGVVQRPPRRPPLSGRWYAKTMASSCIDAIRVHLLCVPAAS